MTEVASDEFVDPLIGQVLDGRYRIVRQLGEGGMGNVYEGVHELIGKKVAIKCLHPEYATNVTVVERFKREARAATAIGHDHIIDVNDLGDLPDGAPYIVMEILDGCELADIMDRGPMPVGRVVRVLRQVCDALSAAHEKGVVHRDLKPENIFLVEKKGNPDFVKVLDFGISKMKEQDRAMKLTSTGMTMGTPHYMSPEQAQGLPGTNHRTDIYALGVILYEALSGVTPFDAETFPLLVVQIVTTDAPSVRLRRPDIPEELDAVLQKALEKNPDRRYQTIDEFSEALKPFEAIDDPPPESAFESLSPVTVVGGRANTGNAATVLESGRGDSLDESSVRPSYRVRQRRTNLALIFGGVLILIGLGAFGIVAMGSPGGEPEAAAESETAAGAVPVPAAVAPTETAAATTKQAMAEKAIEPVAPPKPPEPAKIQVSVVVSPRGAKLFIDGKRYPNPYSGSVLPSDEPKLLRMELDGYEPLEDVVIFSRTDVHAFELTKKTSARKKRKPRATKQGGKDVYQGGKGNFRDDF